MNSDSASDEARDLMLRHLEGAVSPEESRQLDLLLRNSPAAQREYAELLVRVVQLRALGQEQIVPPLRHIGPARAGFWQSTGPRWALAMAACFVALAAWFYFSREPQVEPRERLAVEVDDMPAADAVATLTSGAGLIWESGTNAQFEVGEPLEPGLLRLKSGVAQLELLSGVQVILEGPAEFELISDQETRLNFGKLRAHVPEPAQGFKVFTPRLVVTDLGTEFALNEQPARPPEVHVFVGKVQLDFDNANRPGRELVAGEGVLVEPNDKVEDIKANPKEFVSGEELQRREAEELKARYAEWKRTGNGLAGDPALLVYFNFEDGKQEGGKLPNHAPSARAETDGKIVGCRWVDGRWPGKGALRFTNRSDRVRLKVPGTFESLTYAAWVSIDNLSRPNNALAMSQRFQPGDVRWDISSAGSLRFAVREAGANGEYRTVASPRLMKSWARRWVHLAAVYDGPRRTVSLYINGKRVASQQIPEPVPLVPDDIELGNWNPMLNPPATTVERKERQRPSFKFREFHGRMDEFALLARPLSAAEVRKLYEAGKPRNETVLSAQATPKK